MRNMEISKELKADIESNQIQLKSAIKNHQMLVLRLKADSEASFEPFPFPGIKQSSSFKHSDVQKRIDDAEQEIIVIGLEQKGIIERLHRELKTYEKNLKNNTIKNGIEEKRFNLTNALNRARKQNIITHSASVTSFSASDDSVELPSGATTPEPSVNPINPCDIPQTEYLNYLGLVTHDVCKELQNRRVERKRRSTANPQFLYGSRGWDYQKRKRNAYLVSNVSPPHTRQSAKNKIKERCVSPPSKNNSRASSPVELPKKVLAPFPSIPNLPSGLTIERVNTNRASPDEKVCVVCRQTGNMSLCELCTKSFHVSCHNRPLVQPPRKCPRCLANKDVRTIGALSVPSGMSVSYVSTDVADKLQEKKLLFDKNKELSAELTQLQDRHSQLTISLKNQKTTQEDLLTTRHTTEEKIENILSFINTIKSSSSSSREQTVDSS